MLALSGFPQRLHDLAYSARAHWLAAVGPRLSLIDSLHRQPFSPDHAVSARGIINAEIEAAEHALALLKGHLNAFCPISRLPDELISRILSYHAELEPHFHPDPANIPRLPYGKPLPKRLGWIVSTHVCRRWREVALGTPWLWSNVTFCFGRDAATEFLRRSKNIPLLLDVWVAPLYGTPAFEQYIEWVFDTVQWNIHRTHTLRIVDDFEPSFSTDWKSVVRAAPILKTLWMCNTLDLIQWPAHIFADDAPSLRDVWIRGFRQFPWDPLAFRGITHLRVEHCEDVDEDETDEGEDPDGLVCLEDMLLALPHLCALQSLTIVNTFPARTRAASLGDMPEAALPTLTHLHLEGRLDFVGMLVHRLTWPRGAQVRLVCAPQIPWDRREVVLDALRDRFAQDAHMAAARTLLAGYNTTCRAVCVELWYAELALGIPMPTPPTEPDFRLLVPGPDAHLQELISIFPTASLRTLSVHAPDASRPAGEWPDGEPGWRALFGDAREIRRVYCAGAGAAEGLVAAMYADVGARSRSRSRLALLRRSASVYAPPARVLFPALGMLYCARVDWDTVLNHGTDAPPGRVGVCPWTRAGEREPCTAAEMLSAVARERELSEYPLAAVVYACGGVKACRRAPEWERMLLSRCPELDCFAVDAPDADADEDEDEADELGGYGAYW
ncbi:hypothetical protein K488DRAFT_82239 [Vararia minispora EC-137]|uniref:Uncharacterized protein n=1 Tax=Vararia minispora EC-137 TaxID=1314806 RepID=A0ACB8QXA8_9AGAM|nr:hypothetical protein K488DRAFT_82239 [Vararia minispora EC-137]